MGVAIFDVDGESRIMDEGHLTLVPAGVPHGFVNPGSGLLRLFFTYRSTSAITDNGRFRRNRADRVAARRL